MASTEEWEDSNARGEALRRRVVTEKDAAARSPERSVEVNRPAQQVDDDEEDEDMMEILDLFSPLMPPKATEERRLKIMSQMEWEKYNEEDEKANEHLWLNRFEIDACKFRDSWMTYYSMYGSYDDVTEVKPMRFTDEPAPANIWVNHCHSLQVFSVKVAGIRGGLQWPLRVFGIVAVRDFLDQRRNIIFHRERDDSQTLTEEVVWVPNTMHKKASQLYFVPHPI